MLENLEIISETGRGVNPRHQEDQALLGTLQDMFPDGPDTDFVRTVMKERHAEIELAEDQWVEISEAIEQQV